MPPVRAIASCNAATASPAPDPAGSLSDSDPSDPSSLKVKTEVRKLRKQFLFFFFNTSSKEDDGFHASELRRIDMDSFETHQGVCEDPHVRSRMAVLRVLVDVEERTRRQVQRHAPLDRVQEEQLAPGLLQ